MATALRYAARSDVGLVRSSNQDSAYVGPHLLVVADGMGGHAGGDVASSIAVAELSRLEGESHGADALGHLEEAVRRASARLSERVREEPALAGMGTTVTALLRSGDRLALAHIGDSRAYVLRDGELAQVTHDHTFVQHLVDEGRITAEEAEHHPQRSVLLRVLGDIDSSQELDTSVREARTGDRWLLCSDGLSGMVGHATLREALTGVPDVGECADLLVQLALRGGGSDNVTVVVADVVDVGTAPPDHTAVVGAAAAEHARPTGDATSPAARGAAPGGPAPAGDDGTGGA
ncbi:Stp1/IreP family PP2C-type Ser/Thr phosphatase, partial [Pseudokineococcus marinus]|uniref:Stp1/IreP family PP2C-type Ser/Thr phosphatase n=1 Tax=Pseudokineococcus marinus TaxID=351215 RepID=UPI0031DF95D9